MENQPDPEIDALVKLIKTYNVPVLPLMRVAKGLHDLTNGTGLGRVMVHIKVRKVSGVQVREDWYPEDQQERDT